MIPNDVFHKYFDQVFTTRPLVSGSDRSSWIDLAVRAIGVVDRDPLLKEALADERLSEILPSHRLVLRWGPRANRLILRMKKVHILDLLYASALETAIPQASDLLRRYGWSFSEFDMKGVYLRILRKEKRRPAHDYLANDEQALLGDVGKQIWDALFDVDDPQAAEKGLRLVAPSMWRDFMNYTTEGEFLADVAELDEASVLEFAHSGTLASLWMGKAKGIQERFLQRLIDILSGAGVSAIPDIGRAIAENAHLMPAGSEGSISRGFREFAALACFQAGTRLTADESARFLARCIGLSKSDLFRANIVFFITHPERYADLNIDAGVRREIVRPFYDEGMNRIKRVGLGPILEQESESDAPMWLLFRLADTSPDNDLAKLQKLLADQIALRPEAGEKLLVKLKPVDGSRQDESVQMLRRLLGKEANSIIESAMGKSIAAFWWPPTDEGT